MTSFGLVEDLRVPRTRKGGYRSQFFEPYQRRWKRVDDWIRNLFISGVSARDVSWVMETLLKVEVSRSEVSVIAKMLDNQVKAYHRRSLFDDYVYVFFDGITIKVKSCGKVVKKIILVAYGIKSDGTRELIDFRLARSESAAIKFFKAWKRKWGKLVPKAVVCLEADLEELLVFFEEDKKLWSKIRTTNAIERIFRELRKRTPPMCSFANIASCDRIVYCLFTKYNKKWKEHCYHVAV